jgi:hypothetical protein
VRYGEIVFEGSHERGYRTVGWEDDQTVAYVRWRGYDCALPSVPPPGAPEWEAHSARITEEHELMSILGAIDHYENLELVSAELVRIRK